MSDPGVGEGHQGKLPAQRDVEASFEGGLVETGEGFSGVGRLELCRCQVTASVSKTKVSVWFQMVIEF